MEAFLGRHEHDKVEKDIEAAAHWLFIVFEGLVLAINCFENHSIDEFGLGVDEFVLDEAYLLGKQIGLNHFAWFVGILAQDDESALQTLFATFETAECVVIESVSEEAYAEVDEQKDDYFLVEIGFAVLQEDVNYHFEFAQLNESLEVLALHHDFVGLCSCHMLRS